MVEILSHVHDHARHMHLVSIGEHGIDYVSGSLENDDNTLPEVRKLILDHAQVNSLLVHAQNELVSLRLSDCYAACWIQMLCHNYFIIIHMELAGAYILHTKTHSQLILHYSKSESYDIVW